MTKQTTKIKKTAAKATKTLAADLAAGKELAKDSLGEPAISAHMGKLNVLSLVADIDAAKNRPPVVIPSEMGANEAFPFSILCIAAKDNTVSYERFKNEKARNARLTVLEKDKNLASARAENWKPAAKAVTPAKAKKAVEAVGAKIVKAKKEAAPKELKLRLYAKGEFFFPKLAAEKLNGAPYVKLEAKGKTVTLTPTKSGKDATQVMFCHAAPVLRVAKLLAETGWNKTTQDLPAKMVGDAIVVHLQ